MSFSQSRALRDKLYYFRKCLKIRTKDKRLVPFVPNKPQLKVLQVLRALKQSGSPTIRIAILKARQMGITTLIGALNFHETATMRYVTTAIAAHKDKSATTIFKMYRRFYNHLPDVMKPETKYSNRKELTFETPGGKGIQSNLYVFTAGGKDSVRSDTVHHFHWSEVAFSTMRGVEEVEDAVFPAMPVAPIETTAWYESTANGKSGLFYETFMGGWSNETDWTSIFLPWFEDPSYALPLPPGFELTDIEMSIAGKFTLSKEQMFWRRWKILNDFHGKVSRFVREYPATVDEAFQAKIESAFDQDALRDMEENLCQPKYRCKFLNQDLVQHDTGNVKIWAEPVLGERYIIGVDTAGGGVRGDILVAQVARVTKEAVELVAVMADKIHPYQFGVLSIHLAQMYNDALIVPEANFHGVSFINALVQRGYRRIYKQKDKQNYGITTTGANKASMIDTLHQLIWQRRLIVHDERTFNAVSSFQEDPDTNQFSGPEDDFVMALVMLAQGLPRRYTASPMKEAVGQDFARWPSDIVEWTAEDWELYHERCVEEGVV